MGDHGVEARGREVQHVGISDGKVDAVAGGLVRRERPCDLDEVFALIDPRDSASESVARRDRTAHDAGAATDLQDRCGSRQAHRVEVALPVGHESRILAAELEPCHEALDCRGVLLVDELHGVASLRRCRNGPSLVGVDCR